MASFVESATLVLDDKSSAKIVKINRNLRTLENTAKSVAAALKKIDFNPRGIDKAASSIRSLNTQLTNLSRRAINPKVSVDTSQATAAIAGLRAKAKTINTTVKVNTTSAQKMVHALDNVVLRPRVVISRTNVAQQLNGISFRPQMQPGVFRRVGQEIGRDIANEISNAIVQGVKKATADGFVEQDVAETRLRLQGVSEADTVAINKAVSDAAAKNTVFNRSQLLGLAAEAFPVSKQDTSAIPIILEQEQRLGQTLVELGLSAERARDGLTKYLKAGEQAGRITDAEGKIDPKGLTNFVDIIQKATAQIGRELTPELVEKTFKSARASKMSIDDAGMIALLLAAEETGSTAGVGFNQLIKQLAGTATDKALAQQRRFGISTAGEEVDTGERVGKNKKKQVTTVSADEDLLRTNPLEFVGQYVIPAMKKQGFDPNKPVDVSKFASLVTSDRTATDQLIQLVARFQDIRRGVEQTLKTDVSAAREAETAAQSGVLAVSNAMTALTGAAGSLASSFETILIPAMNGVTSAAKSLENFVLGDEGKPDMARGTIAAGGGIAAIAAGLFGGSKLLGFLTGRTAQTAAVVANTTALNANTAALLGTAGGSAVTKGGTVAAAATAGRMSRIGGLFAVGALVEGLYSALQNVNIESVNAKVTDAKSFAKSISEFVFGSEIANRPDMPANSVVDKPDWVKAWNSFVQSNGKAVSLAVQNGVAMAIAASEKKETAQAITDRVTAQVAAAGGTTEPRIANALALSTAQFPGKMADDLGIGEKITSAATSASQTISTGLDSGGTSAAGSIQNGLISGAQTAAGILANAISSAAAAVRVSVNQPQIAAPVNTGVNRLGHQ